MRLSSDQPRIDRAGLEKIRENLSIGCGCGSETATLTQRIVGASVQVWLQCDKCGKGLGGAHSRKEHPFYQQYPKWDAVKPDQFWKEQCDNNAREFQERQRAQAQQRHDEYVARSREYFLWCRTSQEWRACRNKVIQRANRLCEACLSDEAVTAHHLTYEFGALPPAWCLVAVCRGCHERLHADKRGEYDEWVPEWRRGAPPAED